MTHREEEQAKIRRHDSKHAISLAMEGRWREAVAANLSIISNFPNDVDAFNRLGRAYKELGDYSRAKEAYSKAVELDPYNTIARKNLSRLSLLGEPTAALEVDARTAEPHHFIEEVGKAGVVNLHRLAPTGVLARTVAGDRVYLQTNGANLIVENRHGEHLGMVEPKHAQRLIKLMGGGNKYTAAIVSSTENTLTVIIREVYQHPSQAGRLSFPRRIVEEPRTYVGDGILKHEPEHEETTAEEFGYTVIDEEGVEVSFNEHLADEKIEDEE